jgi:hypothetical protein
MQPRQNCYPKGLEVPMWGVRFFLAMNLLSFAFKTKKKEKEKHSQSL